MAGIVVALLVNVGLTLCIEGIAVALIFRERTMVLASVLGNLLTCPALNLIVLADVHLAGAVGYLPLLVCLELLAVLVEAWVYVRLSDRGVVLCLALSFGLNLLSFGVGLVIHGL
jgi:hypothetical protein